MMPLLETPDDFRFWEKVAFVGASGSDCWLWKAGRDRGGYGVFHMPTGRRNHGAHRWAYIRHFGEPAPGTVLDHFVCSNRACVNPTHLRPASTRENVLRSDSSFPALNAAKTQCPAGHEYDEANTRIKGGRRVCRSCERTQRLIFRQTPEYKAHHAQYEREARARRRGK